MVRSKVLVVAPFPLDPPDAGNRARVANLIAALREAGNEVHFAHVQTGDFDGDAMARRLGADKLHLLPYAAQPPHRNRLSRRLRLTGQRLGVDSAFVWPLDSWYPPGLTPLLAALQQRHRFDAVLVNYVFMSKAFEAFPAPCLRVLDTHDSMGLRHRRYQRAGMRPHWFSTTLEDEEIGFRRADVVIAIQPDEAAEFEKRLGDGPRPRVISVGHLVKARPPQQPSDDPPDTSPEKPSALFLGSHNPINIHGLAYFLAHVHPLVRRAVPDFELIAAGPVAKEVPDQSGLVKLGYVDDLDEAFRSAMVFVSPVLMGTGVAIKLLDAMASGMPCVCTRTGARGLEQEAEAIEVVDDDDPAMFAERVVALLTDPALRASRRASAREAAEQWNRRQLAALSTLMAQIGSVDTA